MFGTHFLFLGSVIVLSSMFILADVKQAEKFSFGDIVNDVGAAAFWPGLELLGTFYVSIPAAAVIVAAVRWAYSRLRRRRSQMKP